MESSVNIVGECVGNIATTFCGKGAQMESSVKWSHL